MRHSQTHEPRSPIEQWWGQFRRRRERSTTSHVEVYLSACAPVPGTHAQRNCFFDRLAAATDEQIESYGTTVLGNALCRCERCRSRDHHRDLLATVTELMTWEGAGLTGCGFVEREIDSTVTGEQYSVISPPALSVGVYVDDALVGVFPCQDNDSHYTPEQFLTRLCSGGVEHRDAPDRSPTHGHTG